MHRCRRGRVRTGFPRLKIDLAALGLAEIVPSALGLSAADNPLSLKGPVGFRHDGSHLFAPVGFREIDDDPIVRAAEFMGAGRVRVEGRE